MKIQLAVLLLTGTALFAADAPPREVFPSDYRPQPCAPSAEAVCEGFAKYKLTDYAKAFRGFDVDGKWVDLHWDEMRQAFLPICGKMANCFTVPGNDWVFCLDLMRDDMLATCNRFPAGSRDRDQCTMFAMTYFIGLGAKTKLHAEAQTCAAKTPLSGERTLEVWMMPATIGPDFEGRLTVYAIDTETRIPVRAKLSVDGGDLRSTEGPIPTAGYPVLYEPRLKRVPGASGHRDVVAPVATLTWPGYKDYTFTMPMAVPKVIVEISPQKLVRGKNKVTVTARDAETGKPVEMRVMGGDLVLGDTNKPFELELARREKRPEIWVTSLYDRYSDVVVLQGE